MAPRGAREWVGRWQLVAGPRTFTVTRVEGGTAWAREDARLWRVPVQLLERAARAGCLRYLGRA